MMMFLTWTWLLTFTKEEEEAQIEPSEGTCTIEAMSGEWAGEVTR